MKSVVLCEGKDDRWFIAYYLHKTAGWNTCNAPWRNYNIVAITDQQEVTYLKKDSDSVAIWCVGGKDCFDAAISTIFTKFIRDFPFDPINSIIIVGDRDNNETSDVISKIQTWIPYDVELNNKSTTIWAGEIDGYDVSVKITPVIIPFLEEGAIETLLMGSIREQDREGEIIVRRAKEYIDGLLKTDGIGQRYLSHERLILKAKYAAVIAATNPEHSTSFFRDMVMACPWEESLYVKDHFDIIVNAITSNVS